MGQLEPALGRLGGLEYLQVEGTALLDTWILNSENFQGCLAESRSGVTVQCMYARPHISLNTSSNAPMVPGTSCKNIVLPLHQKDQSLRW